MNVERAAPRGAAIVVGTTQGIWSRGVSPDAVFEIGSISKTFTATLLAALVDDGVVALDDPVARYLPVAPPVIGRAITLEDLATHHSGLPRLPKGLLTKSFTTERHDPYASFDATRLERAIAETAPKRAPGEKFTYSNFGYGLLGHALARAAGTTYAELVRARITEPLQLTRTGLDVEPLAQGHGLLGRPAHSWDLAELAGAGGIRSTARDMVAYLEAHARGGPPFAATHAPRRSVGKIGVGLAWIILPDSRLTHDGGTGGFRSFAGLDPRTGAVTVVLAARARSVTRFGLKLLQAPASSTRS